MARHGGIKTFTQFFPAHGFNRGQFGSQLLLPAVSNPSGRLIHNAKALRCFAAAPFIYQEAQASLASWYIKSPCFRKGFWVAEREGFEPSIALPLYQLSRRALSTTQAPLQQRKRTNKRLKRRSYRDVKCKLVFSGEFIFFGPGKI
jgi:hypothetical protein